MSDVLRAFHDFLIANTVQTDPVREAGRQAFQGNVDIVEDSRVKRPTRPAVATLSILSDQPSGAIDQPVDITTIMVEFELFTRDSDTLTGAARARIAATGLRDWINKYRGPLNGTVSVQGIFYESGPISTPLKPTDASGNWKYRYIITYMLAVPIQSASGVS